MSGAPSPSPSHGGNALGLSAVTAVLDRLRDAWNAGDAVAYAAEFTEDASYVAFNGQIMRGRTEIEQVHRMLFEGPLRGSRTGGAGTSPESVPPRLVHPGVAVVVQDGGIRPEGAGELTDDRRSVITFTLVETDDGRWRIAAFQNTRRQPAGEAGGRP